MGSDVRGVVALVGAIVVLGAAAHATERDFDAGAGLAAAWSSRDGGLGGGTLRLGVRWWPSSAPVGRPSAAALLVGDVPGVDLRARILLGAPAGHFGTVFTVGLGSGLMAQVGPKRSRVPSLLGLVLPEVGVLVRSYAPARAYLGWSAPFGYQAKGWSFLSIELTPTVLVVPSSDGTEYVALLGLSGLGR
jgi:hypothetical protein